MPLRTPKAAYCHFSQFRFRHPSACDASWQLYMVLLSPQVCGVLRTGGFQAYQEVLSEWVGFLAADNINPDSTYPSLPANYTDATGPGTFYLFTAGEGLNSATYQPEWVSA